MLSETILLPKSIKDAEERFVIKLKEQLLSMIKEINRLEKRIASIKEFTGLEDLLNSIRGKANVDASNVGKNGAVDTSLYWGRALGTGDVLEYNEKLVTGGTMHTELRPPGTVTAYNYVGPTFSTAENLISLDAKVKEIDDELKAIVFPVWDTSHLARIDLKNIDWEGEDKINNIARASIEIKSEVGKNGQPLYPNRIRKELEARVETYYIDFGGGGGGGGGQEDSDLRFAFRNARNIGWSNWRDAYYDDGVGEVSDWLGALAYWNENKSDAILNSTDDPLPADCFVSLYLLNNQLYRDLRSASNHYYTDGDKTVGENLSLLDTQLNLVTSNWNQSVENIDILEGYIGVGSEPYPDTEQVIDPDTGEPVTVPKNKSLIGRINDLQTAVWGNYSYPVTTTGGIQKYVDDLQNTIIGSLNSQEDPITTTIGPWKQSPGGYQQTYFNNMSLAEAIYHTYDDLDSFKSTVNSWNFTTWQASVNQSITDLWAAINGNNPNTGTGGNSGSGTGGSGTGTGGST